MTLVFDQIGDHVKIYVPGFVIQFGLCKLISFVNSAPLLLRKMNGQGIYFSVTYMVSGLDFN